VYQLSADDTVTFAATELESYLAEMTGRSVSVTERSAYAPADGGLWLGTGADLPDIDLPAVENERLDDAIHVDTEGGEGVIAGVNPRSVLLATYRYLRELGCRWVRPGDDGEILPELDSLPTVSVAETPSYRHRGITIEGAVSVEHVTDLVDWAPKVGYNAYFIQFFDGYPFFRRWYRHEKNPERDAEAFSEERARECYERCVAEIERRGLVYHEVGHGWTARALDMPVRGWETEDLDVPDAKHKYLAEIDGDRRVYEDIPINTELCYSNPEARRLVVDAVADYAEETPAVDILHFWASDAHNNHCECADCQETRPADFYVQICNELDAELAVRGLDTRISFLIYTDLLWPPERERFETPERFSLMFAPITRSYASGYADLGEIPELPPYERNELDFPASLEENVGFLRAWQDVFDGDSFDFDYHLMLSHYHDPGTMQVGTILADDMRDLDVLGLDGNVSCQVQRAFFPTGVLMTAMAARLWDRDRPLDDIIDDHLAAEFGDDAAEVRAYLQRLSDAFDPFYSSDAGMLQDSDLDFDGEAVATLESVPDIVEAFTPRIEDNIEQQTGTHKQSWTYLKEHAGICATLGPALAAIRRGEEARARDSWQSVRSLVLNREETLHPVLDVFTFVRVFDALFGVDDTV
jgi:hypothetical protein